jgi:hypothetical protein
MSENLPTSNQDSGLSQDKLIQSGLDVKMNAINRYEEIIWKMRSGYIVILYGALTLLMGQGGLSRLGDLAGDFTASISVFFLIFGLSLSVFSIDFGYLRKKIRVIVIRDMLIEVAYDPNCKFKEKLNLLLHVSAETPLKTHFKFAELKYKSKLRWNLLWILLPIYATTPVLAIAIYLIHPVVSKCK